jgi:hypothetical protein
MHTAGGAPAGSGAPLGASVTTRWTTGCHDVSRTQVAAVDSPEPVCSGGYDPVTTRTRNGEGSGGRGIEFVRVGRGTAAPRDRGRTLGDGSRRPGRAATADVGTGT